jgi:iron complex transport system permease protein
VVVTGDLIARTAIPYQELPLGVLTAVVGGPFFFWLLRRTRSRAGGWG